VVQFVYLSTVVTAVCRLSAGVSEPTVHEGSQCHCMSSIPDKYRQVLATQSECYADIPDILLTVDSCSNYVV